MRKDQDLESAPSPREPKLKLRRTVSAAVEDSVKSRDQCGPFQAGIEGSGPSVDAGCGELVGDLGCFFNASESGFLSVCVKTQISVCKPVLRHESMTY